MAVVNLHGLPTYLLSKPFVLCASDEAILDDFEDNTFEDILLLRLSKTLEDCNDYILVARNAAKLDRSVPRPTNSCEFP